MAEYEITHSRETGRDIYTLKLAPYDKDAHGNLVFDSRTASLQDLITASGREFSNAPWERIFFLPFDNVLWHVGRDLSIGVRQAVKFSPVAENHVFTHIQPEITLLQIVRIAEQIPNCDFKDVRFSWTRGPTLLCEYKK